jgi:hypothetical protein
VRNPLDLGTQRNSREAVQKLLPSLIFSHAVAQEALPPTPFPTVVQETPPPRSPKAA